MDGPTDNASSTTTRTNRKSIHLGAGKTQTTSATIKRANIEKMPNIWRAKNSRYFLAYPSMTKPQVTGRSRLTSLPLELRQLIYTFVLDKEDSDQHSAFDAVIGDPSYPGVLKSDIWALLDRDFPPIPHSTPLLFERLSHYHASTSVGSSVCPCAYSLLLTSREIHQDFALFLYDACTFHLQDPTSASNWLWNIGANIGNIRKLHIRISSSRYDREASMAWYDVLQQLAEQALALQFLRVSFVEDVGLEYMYSLEAKHMCPSTGESTTLMWALGEIRTLRTIELAGEYSEILPRYLKRATGARVSEVRVECEVCYPKRAQRWMDFMEYIASRMEV